MARHRLDYNKFDSGVIEVAVVGDTTIFTSEILDSSYREMGLHLENTDAEVLDKFTLQVEMHPNSGFEDYISDWSTESNYVVRATKTLNTLAASTTGLAHVLLPPCNRIRLVGSSAVAASGVRAYGSFGRI